MANQPYIEDICDAYIAKKDQQFEERISCLKSSTDDPSKKKDIDAIYTLVFRMSFDYVITRRDLERCKAQLAGDYTQQHMGVMPCQS